MNRNGRPDIPVGRVGLREINIPVRGKNAPPTMDGIMVTSKKVLKRRHHLPHWQLGGSVYFVTFRSVHGSLPKECMDAVVKTVLTGHGKKFDLLFGVVMPDHVHLLLQPLAKRGTNKNGHYTRDKNVPPTMGGVTRDKNKNGHGRLDIRVERAGARESNVPARDKNVPPLRGKNAPPTIEYFDLSEIMKGIKGSSARRINQILGIKGKVWQEESFDRIVRDEDEFIEKLHYMYDNPVKTGLVDDPEKYDFYIKLEKK